MNILEVLTRSCFTTQNTNPDRDATRSTAVAGSYGLSHCPLSLSHTILERSQSLSPSLSPLLSPSLSPARALSSPPAHLDLWLPIRAFDHLERPVQHVTLDDLAVEDPPDQPLGVEDCVRRVQRDLFGLDVGLFTCREKECVSGALCNVWLRA